MENIILNIKQYRNLVEQDMTNDFFVYPFLNLISKIFDDKGILTDKGLSVLHYDISDLMNKVMDETKSAPAKKDRTRACLYFTIIFNIATVVCGFIESLSDGEEETKKYLEYIDDDLLDFFKKVKDRAVAVIPISEAILKQELPKMDDKYSHFFDEGKRDCFTKELFQRPPLVIENKDMPDTSNAKSI